MEKRSDRGRSGLVLGLIAAVALLVPACSNECAEATELVVNCVNHYCRSQQGGGCEDLDRVIPVVRANLAAQYGECEAGAEESARRLIELGCQAPRRYLDVARQQLPPDREEAPIEDRPAVTYAGQDLSGQDLSDRDLTSADLRGADLSGAILVRARLDGADLREAELAGADLEQARFEGANLSGLDLSRTHFGPRAFIRHADLSDTNLAGVSWVEARLTECDLSGANLSGALLRQARLSELNVDGANLAGADLSGASIVGGDWTDARLTEIQLARTRLSGGLDWSHLALTGADLLGAHLGETRFEGADLAGVVLQQADLGEADFTAANLQGANFLGARGRGPNLNAADLTGANFSYSELGTECSLIHANLTRTVWTGVERIWCDMSGAIVLGADFRGVDFGVLDLTGLDLSLTQLGGANLELVTCPDGQPALSGYGCEGRLTPALPVAEP